jgi:hypothetical protein
MRSWICGVAASISRAAGGAQAAEIIAGMGPGGGAVSRFATPGLTQTASFQPYGTFTGGVSVAAGDVNGDGTADIVTGAGPGGGPIVTVFDGVTGAQLHSFSAFDAGFAGGVTVAAGDVNGDGKADVIVGAGPGGGPHVKVFDGVTGTELRNFDAFEATFLGGVSVAAGDVNGDGHADLVVGAGPGGGPHVRVFDGLSGGELHNFDAFDAQFLGGVTVATGHRSLGDTIIVGTASMAGQVRVFDPGAGLVDSFFAFDPGYAGGVSVAGGSFGRQDSLIVGQLQGGLVNVFAADRARGVNVSAVDGGGVLASFRPFSQGGVNVAAVFDAVAVPEPSAWALMLLGFFGIGGLLRRRSAAAA